MAAPTRPAGPHFIHPCTVCNHPVAPFGKGVFLLKGQPGRWFCAKHRPEDKRK